MYSSAFAETVSLLMEATGFDKQLCEELVNEVYEQAINWLVSIKKACAENNFKEAGGLLHQLKGSSGNVRMNELSKLALESEAAIKLMDYEMLGSLLGRMEESLEGFK